MSNVPQLKITATGVTIPQSVDIRTGVLADTNQAFGGELDVVTPSTPQAYLADNLTQNIVDANAQVAYFVNQVDPANAEGRMQDAIARIYFLDRNGATASLVQATCVGQVGVTLPAGMLAQDDFGNLWVSTDSATFPSGGSAVIPFACQTLGPVELGIGQLTRIAQAYNGWDAITNLNSAYVGNSTESRAQFETRRKEYVSANAHGSTTSIRSAVWGVDGVLDVFAYDNFTNSVMLYGCTNYPIAPHSIYVGVLGGESEDVAKAIWTKKDCGCDMNGNTSVVVQDKDGYSYPYPQYTIKFHRPTATPIKFSIQLANNSSLPSNITQLTKDAIRATFNGENGAQRARMGGTIFASNFYAAVASVGASVSILQIKVGISAANLDSVVIGIDQSPTISDSDITVALV